MADTPHPLKRGPGRPVWLRVRKSRPKLMLSRRARRRLGTSRCSSRRRGRRRLLQAAAAAAAAAAAGAEWRESACPAAATWRPKIASPRPAPSPTPAPTFAPSCPASGPIAPLRHLGPGRALLLLRVEQSFTFSGVCRLTCLYGQVEVFGFILSQGQPAREVFSTCTHAYLTINAVHYSMPERSWKEMKKEARVALRSHLSLEDRSWSMKNFSPLCSIVLLERLKNSTVNFIGNYLGLPDVFLQESPTLQINAQYVAMRSVGIKKEKRKKGLHLTETALAALEELVSASCEEINGCPIILVCGSQDVGKSTFSRYLINQLLNSISCVDYLECDLGQTEFTPPGCISLLNITEPILGPPFTHQRRPQKMVYYGKPTCKDSCESYIEIVKYVFSSYKREAPLIVNTMGWVTDSGLLLLIDLIRLLAPSHVVQVSSSQSKCMPALTPEYVEGMDGLYTKSKSRVRHQSFELPEFAESLELSDEDKEYPVILMGHKLINVQSEFCLRKTDRNRESHNQILRDLAVLGYLGQLLPPTPEVLPLHGLIPYEVPFNSVALRITHSDVAPTHIMYALNASWVGLCRILDDVTGYSEGPILLAQTPICDCLGFGICRGIDMEKQRYHILTPVPPEELRTVNCLLVGAVSVPHSVFKSQHGLEGTIPYVTTDYNMKLPGASEKLGLREGQDITETNMLRRPRLYQRSQPVPETGLKYTVKKGGSHSIPHKVPGQLRI